MSSTPHYFHNCQTQDVKQVLKTNNALTNTQREVITGITRDLSAALNVNNTLSVLPRDLTTTTNLVGELARYVCEGVNTLSYRLRIRLNIHANVCTCIVHQVRKYILSIHFTEYVYVYFVYRYICSVCIQ